jgi:hypothetical protein
MTLCNTIRSWFNLRLKSKSWVVVFEYGQKFTTDIKPNVKAGKIYLHDSSLVTPYTGVVIYDLSVHPVKHIDVIY